MIKIATQKLVDKGYKNIVDDIMYLGTPVRDDYKTNNEVLKKKSEVLNVYDKSDFIQKKGGYSTTKFINNYISDFYDYHIETEFGKAEQLIDNNPRVKNIEVEAPDDINIYNILPLTSLGKYIKDEKIQDHRNIDSVEVLNQVKKATNVTN